MMYVRTSFKGVKRAKLRGKRCVFGLFYKYWFVDDGKPRKNMEKNKEKRVFRMCLKCPYTCKGMISIPRWSN